jgi:hypothetical protein
MNLRQAGTTLENENRVALAEVLQDERAEIVFLDKP